MASTSSSERTAHDPLRPADHVDSAPEPDGGASGVAQPKLGPVGWLRFAWRQLTSMRTALLLLLLLAIAAVPGSLVPQRSSDPNGVTQYFQDNPDLAPVLDSFQMFDVYTSAWFSAVYLLLFVSLIGCIIPRTKHHLEALRARPPRTPVRLSRLAGYTVRSLPELADGSEGGAGSLRQAQRAEVQRAEKERAEVQRAEDERAEVQRAEDERAEDERAEASIADAAARLKRAGYRVERYDLRGEASVSAERGYLRETGNLVFHTALLGVLATVAIGGGFGFSGQRVVVEGQSFVNTLGAYDSFNPGRFFDDAQLSPYRLSLEGLDAVYETQNADAIGQPIDFTAHVVVEDDGGSAVDETVKVNEPLRTHGTDVYLLGNGYAPTVTVRNPDGEIVFTDSVPFLPQDANLTSIGVIKVTDGLDEQLGMVGFFYPTQDVLSTGAYASTYPDLVYPVLTLNVYEGDLGIDDGTPTSVYALDPSGMTQLTGGTTGVDSIELKPGETAELPGGRGTVTLEDASPAGTADGDLSHSVKRFASFDIHHDPTQGWVLVFAILIIAGLLVSLFVPRRRMWVKAVRRRDGRVVLEYAGLARGDDPGLDDAVRAFADAHGGPAADDADDPSTPGSKVDA
ncbi:cytochrome c biogenesis protein ResB [Agromyces larvae]|uniref:Cytochrome c biogenesis protein ResB n=1 Tax=Agromyces larvae TaxID=2929802 RepID=A0ABY4BYH3_9MICO|nr:cytochrome c biogenesis protein ResB [Agromyces larvae]UOE43784.1 cytochrome c biogenesis protein ResB [Agromyces larvae]